MLCIRLMDAQCTAKRFSYIHGDPNSVVAYPQGGMTAQAMSFVVRLKIQDRRRRAQIERSETLSTCHLLYFSKKYLSVSIVNEFD